MSYAIGPILQGLSTGAGEVMQGIQMGKADDRLNQALQTLRDMPGLQLPAGSYQGVGYAGDFDPQTYQTPEQAQATTINTDPATRAIQMQALQQLIDRGNGAADAQQQAAQFKALDSANQLANARQGAIRQQMESRGQGGSGLNAILQAQAAQDAANRAQGGTLDAQSQAALQKLAALQYAGNAAGAVRGQDFQNAAANADILNRFNLFNTQANNAASQANVGIRNEAALRNLSTRQGLLGTNTGIANSNLDRMTQNARDIYGANAAKAGAVSGALTGMAGNAMTQGQMFNNMGQQAGQYFGNLGAGITAHDAAQSQNAASQPTPNTYTSPDGSFSSWWDQ